MKFLKSETLVWNLGAILVISVCMLSSPVSTATLPDRCVKNGWMIAENKGKVIVADCFQCALLMDRSSQEMTYKLCCKNDPRFVLFCNSMLNGESFITSTGDN